MTMATPPARGIRCSRRVASLVRVARLERRKIDRTRGVRSADKMKEIEPRNKSEYTKSPCGPAAQVLIRLVCPLLRLRLGTQGAVVFRLPRRRFFVSRGLPPVLS